MATLVSAPQYPIPKQTCKITFTGLDPETNFITLFPVTAPVGSSLREAIDSSKGARVNNHQGASNEPWIFTPEVGGVYTFFLQETSIRASSGSLFQNDPTGASNPSITAQGEVVLYVGEALQLTIGDSPDEVTLRLYVWNDTIRSTSIAVHDEDTPALIEPGSPAAENAIYNSGVTDAVTELVNKSATAVAGTLPADFVTVRNLYQAHADSIVAHTNNDDVNTLSSGYTATNPKAAESAIKALRAAIDAHAEQLKDVSDAAVHSQIDGATAFYSSGAGSDPGTQFYALADALVRLRAHAEVAGHASTVSIAGTVGPLTELCVKYIEALKLASPANPAAKNPAAAILGQFGGFTAV